MESTIVIKVKYQETLRRFNARVNEAGQLDLDMGGLREKVLGLFNFAPDADLVLTYIDEDGDVVTLAEEEDLLDVMRQSLNPLRIAVKLNAERGGRSYTILSGSSTPIRSPGVQYLLPNLNSNVSDSFKSVPGPFHEALSKLSLELASKAASSAPGLAELVDSFSKMGQSDINPLSGFQSGTKCSTQSGASGSAMGASMTKEPEVSKDDGATSEVIPDAKFEEPTYKTNPKVDLEKGARVEASVTPPSSSLNLNTGLPGDSFLSGCGSANLAPVASRDTVYDGKDDVKKLGESQYCEKAGDFEWPNFKSVAPNFGASDHKDVRKSNKPKKSVCAIAFASAADSMKHSTVESTNTNLGGSASTRIPNLNLINECPFTGMPVASDDSAVPSMHYSSRVPPFKRSHNHSKGMGSIFHRGVRCDGCGVHPITGPRFKSKVKENYDLCSICFAEMGNEADYFRMDRPVSYRHPHSYDPAIGRFYPRLIRANKKEYASRLEDFREFDWTGLDLEQGGGSYEQGLLKECAWSMGQKKHQWVHPPPLPHVLRGCGMKPSRLKLGSRFIVDVNVLDGTIMAPSTPFTKIWRMRNNGTTVWPQGTQLVWIGGDKLSNALSVEFQIPFYGLPVENELDVAVDFTAPELPGRYISYWRMASPSGQKFGQRVWVLIQVDASLTDSCGSFQGLNLNLPPDSNGLTGPEMVNVNVEPIVVEGSLPEPNNSNRATDLVEPIVGTHPIKDQELNFPINDTLLVGGGGVSNPVAPEVHTTVSYPIIDLTEVVPAVPSHVPSPSIYVPAVPSHVPSPSIYVPAVPSHLPSSSTYVPASPQGASQNNDVEQDLLRELEEMGFRQVDLNKEILRMNEYDLEQAVDDLCGVDEWDPILEDLQEMGFCDKEMNKKLLEKNNGSIKRVVMDLVAKEK